MPGIDDRSDREKKTTDGEQHESGDSQLGPEPREGDHCRPAHCQVASGGYPAWGVQPEEGAQIPGIRKWPEAYLPKIYDASRVDCIVLVSQAEAEDMTRRMAREEGIFAGISSGGALAAALKISAEVHNAVIVSIVCDRGDRYLSTGVFPG